MRTIALEGPDTYAPWICCLGVIGNSLCRRHNHIISLKLHRAGSSTLILQLEKQALEGRKLGPNLGLSRDKVHTYLAC